jgi:nitrous oxidase accessory protein NosD
MPLIEGVEIVGAHPEADGIELSGTMQAIITRVAVRKARHGIRLVERNRNVVISDCHLYENSGVGIFLDAVNLHQINVANTHVSYNGGGGIVVRDGEVRNLHVSGCDIEANMPGDETPTETANILIDQASEEAMGSVAEVAITGCTIQHSAHYGRKKVAPGGANIRILGSDRHRPNMIAVTGNILSDTTTHLHLRKVMDVTVTGNTFFTTEPTDLLIEDCRRVTVTGNAFNPREEGAVGGIVLRDSAHCILSGLTIHRFGRGGGSVMMERCFASRMTSCILSDCQSGIRLVDCEGCVVSDCTLTGLPVGAKPVEASGKENTVRGILSLGRDVLDAGGSE